MRWACALILLLVPTGLAQSVIMEDASGDVTSTMAGGTPAPATVAATGPYDLVGFWIDESPEAFTFRVQVQDLALDSATFGNGAIHAQFQHADRTFRTSWYRSESLTVNYQGELSMFDSGRGGWVRLDFGPAQVDASANTLAVLAAREQLADGNGTIPQAGRSLERFEAFSSGAGQPFFGGAVTQVSDRMPDDGFGVPYAVVHGLPQTGFARLASDDPVRASNGEKATFVYHVRASNLDAQEQRFRLAAQDVPDGWEVTLPAATIRLDNNTTRSFPVLISVPFQHVHGAFEHVTLEMKAQHDPASVGRLQLGIRYLEVPQPAGHHDRLYLHSRNEAGGATFDTLFGPSRAAYMNTLEDDELDEGVPVPAQASFISFGGPSRWSWEVYLEPGLEMGLDFDRNRTGTVEALFSANSQTGISSAQVSGQLVHLAGQRAPDGSLRGTRTTVLADIVPGSPATLNGDGTLTATIQPTREGDFVAYDRDAALVLRLVLQGESIGVGATADTVPALRGGQMQLPLNEYRDPVEGILNALAGLSFVHDSRPERQVNPGETVLFNLTLQNDGAVDDTFELRINGTNPEWAYLLGDQRIFVPTGSQRAVVVAVHPPGDAPNGDVVDLIVTAASQAEPTVQGNIRVLAVVDTVLDHPDDSRFVMDLDKSLRREKQSPLPFALFLAPLLFVRALRR